MQAVCIVAKLKEGVKVATVAGVVRVGWLCRLRKHVIVRRDVKVVVVVCGGDLEVKNSGWAGGIEIW